MSSEQQSTVGPVPSRDGEIPPVGLSGRIDFPPPQGLALRTPRMLLRTLGIQDREAFITAAAASRSQLDIFLPLHKACEGDEAMFQRQLHLAAPASKAQHIAAQSVRLVGLLPDGRIVGGFNINTITRGLEWKADINWWVATLLAGNGLATEGVAAILRHALADLPDGLGLHTIYAWIMRDNAASIRVAEKVGLTRAGDEKSYIRAGGRWVLHDLYVQNSAAG